MKKPSNNIASVVARIVEPVISEMKYELWDVEFVKEGADYYLRITIDCENGITIDDCEKVHRAVDPLLDEADPIEESYHLEVSSPGIERELKYDWHYDEFIGSEVEVKLFAPVAGSRIHRGKLVSYFEGNVTINSGNGNVLLPKEKISKVNTVFNFEDIKD